MRQASLVPGEFPSTCQVLKAGVDEGVAPGFVASFWDASQPDVFHVTAAGARRLIPSAQPMLPETVFDLASITKVFGTAALTALLVERGVLQWNMPLCVLLPGYRFREIQIQHLLSHTAGLPAWKPLWVTLLDRFGAGIARAPIEDRQHEMRALVTQVEPEERPGARAVYSDIGFLLLGFALEEALKMPLDQAVSSLLWQPMRISGAHFRRVNRPACEAQDSEVAATESCPWRGSVLQGQVHDDNCWAMGGYAGHAGAFARAEDLVTFAAGLLSGDLFSAQVLKTMWSKVASPPGCERTLGWDTPSGLAPAVGKYFSNQTVGHLGYTGTSLWLDLKARLAVVLLSNRVHPNRDNSKIRAFRSRFHDALREDLLRRR